MSIGRMDLNLLKVFEAARGQARPIQPIAIGLMAGSGR